MSNSMTEDSITENRKLTVEVSGTKDKLKNFFVRAMEDMNMMGRIYQVSLKVTNDMSEDEPTACSLDDEMMKGIDGQITQGAVCEGCLTK